MLDAKLLRNEPDKVRGALKDRGADQKLVDNFLKIDEKWRAVNFKIEELNKKRNEQSAEVAKLKAAGKDATSIIKSTKEIGDKIKEHEEERRKIEVELDNVILYIPNIPHESVPRGKDASANQEVRKWGDPKSPIPSPQSHDVIGTKLGILNFDRAAKISGSRFVVYEGWGAKLERALINFMLDVQSGENGYKEMMTPVLVTRDCMVGTGQLPKFEEDMFRLKDDPFYLIPTAEVSLTNLHREEIIPAEKLPINYCAYTPCFRREAGSYGKDVKGIIRQHQFNKVELVKFCDPEKSYQELEQLTVDAESILRKLNLPYRVMALSTGDMGFSAAKTYDLEVWFPSENKYREISSCSNFEDFQARRANIRFRKGKDKPQFVHNLNGSGLAVGRCLAAILENYQQPDGSVIIPEALRNLLKCDKISL